MTIFTDNTDTDTQIERVYEAAASLFDPDTTLDLSREYDRGVTELVTRMMGIDSDDKDDVAGIISDYTSTAHMLTVADFGTGVNGDLLYIGPLKVAQDFIYKHDNTVQIERVRYSETLMRVEMADGNSYGVGDTEELAWRYALAAEFGPIDEEFHPFRLK